MNAPFEPVHSPFGGSVAARNLGCPANVKLIEQVPESLRRSSSYATIRGTTLHVALPRLIERECSLNDLVGETIGDYTITSDDVENALRPVLGYVEALLDQPGAEYFLERRIVFPGIANTFGTADLIIRIGDTIYVIDFKFGSGVRVLAIYPDGDEDVLNAQLLFYAAAARYSLPEFFAGVDNIILSILQPQSIEVDAELESSVAVTPEELDAFVTAYRAVCTEALSEAPRLARGPWCRFCPAKPICPLHTAPLLDLAQFELPAPSALPSKDAYLQLLAAGLNLVDAVKEIGKALHDQAKQALHAGDTVPGYALSAGRAERQWRGDEDTTIAALQGLGLGRDDIIAKDSPRSSRLRLASGRPSDRIGQPSDRTANPFEFEPEYNGDQAIDNRMPPSCPRHRAAAPPRPPTATQAGPGAPHARKLPQEVGNF